RHFAQGVNRLAAHLVAPRDLVKADERHALKGMVNGPAGPIVNWQSSLLLLLLRLATLDLLPLFQIPADGLVSSGDHFLSFLQTLDDLGVILVADAGLYRRHLC